MQLEWYYRTYKLLKEALEEDELAGSVKIDSIEDARHPHFSFFVPINEFDEGDIILTIYFDPYNQEFYFKDRINDFEAKLIIHPIWDILRYMKELYEDCINQIDDDGNNEEYDLEDD